LYLEVLERPGGDTDVVRISMVVIGYDSGGRFVWLVCWSVSAAADR
jgi:hypothetical protein